MVNTVLVENIELVVKNDVCIFYLHGIVERQVEATSVTVSMPLAIPLCKSGV